MADEKVSFPIETKTKKTRPQVEMFLEINFFSPDLDGSSLCVGFCHPKMGAKCPVSFEPDVELKHLCIFNEK